MTQAKINVGDIIVHRRNEGRIYYIVEFNESNSTALIKQLGNENDFGYRVSIKNRFDDENWKHISVLE